VSATHGRITLRGPVLAAEHANLLKSIATVHGVTNVDDRLSIHESAEGISALQGGDPPAGQPMEFMQRSWSPAARTLSGGAGGALMLYSLAKRGPLGAVALATGAAMLVRAATNRPFSELSRRRPVKHGYAPEQIPSQLTERAAGPEV
jgi:hypothetical protein